MKQQNIMIHMFFFFSVTTFISQTQEKKFAILVYFFIQCHASFISGASNYRMGHNHKNVVEDVQLYNVQAQATRTAAQASNKP